MKKYKIMRTVSYYNDETDDILTDFYKEYPNAIAEIIEEVSISGILTEEIKCEGYDDLVSFCKMAECLEGECFSVYDESGGLVLTEEFND